MTILLSCLQHDSQMKESQLLSFKNNALPVSAQQISFDARRQIGAQKQNVKKEEETCSLPEQINFISMNPCSLCFLLAHLNRQEANFNCSLQHSAAIYATTKTGRERKTAY